MRAGPVALRRRQRALAAERRRRSLDGRRPTAPRGAGSQPLDAREETGGLFDPAVLPALVAAGYDRSFEELEPRAARAAFGWRAGAAVEVDHTRARARIEPGAAVDLGGIGKGFSADRAVRAMIAAWPSMPGCVVDLGGDIAVWGKPPDRGTWRIAVADPRHGGRLSVLQPARRRGRDLRTRPAPLRARRRAAPPDRPGDRRAGCARAAGGHRRRP